MEQFPSIDQVNDILNEIAGKLPKDFFKNLNEGIVLLAKYKLHPQSRDTDKLYIMGEYTRSVTGRNIKIYYGSFKRVYKYASRETIYEKLEETLLHEFTHHLESLAGERGLEIKDKDSLDRYQKRWKPQIFIPLFCKPIKNKL